jgi:2OG-Fe(II) oxygenase superfamily
LKSIVNRLRYYVQWLADRSGYFRTKLFGLRAPAFPLALLPNGFSISWAGKTGIAIVDNFVTREEADYLTAKADGSLTDSQITVGNKRIKDSYRTSQTAIVLNPYSMDPTVIAIVRRAAMLFSLPASHVESVYVTRYGGGEYYKAHQDAYPGFDGDRLYTALIYLNDLEENAGGSTVFEKLNIGVRPKCGRAVLWTNKNQDGSTHPETLHEAMPVSADAVKWVIQLWFRGYPMMAIPKFSSDNPQTKRGQPLHGNEILPDGVWAPGEVAEGSDYAKAFS